MLGNLQLLTLINTEVQINKINCQIKYAKITNSFKLFDLLLSLITLFHNMDALIVNIILLGIQSLNVHLQLLHVIYM